MSDSDALEFGKELKRLRERVGLSLEELAKELEVGVMALMRWESGESRPSLHVLSRLIEILLSEGAFTQGQERAEAEKLWKLGAPGLKFDKQWFADLLKRRESPPIKIFCSFSYQDTDLSYRLLAHLAPLMRRNMIDVWDDSRIPVGANSQEEIKRQLESADIILMLVSANFIASNDIANAELDRILQKYATGKVRMLPILVRPVDWTHTFLADLPALPHNGRPVSLWENQDQAFMEIARGIRRVCEEVQAAKAMDEEYEKYVADTVLQEEYESTFRTTPDEEGSLEGWIDVPRSPMPTAEYDEDELRTAPIEDERDEFETPVVEKRNATSSRSPSTGKMPAVGPVPASKPDQYQLYEVFKRSGIPQVTFVEREDFLHLKLALAQPGRGVVIEGPSGIGKTTAVKKAIESLAAAWRRAGSAMSLQLFSARNPEHCARLQTLASWHRGTVIIDDFHRLDAGLRTELIDYLKFLADTEPEDKKLVIVGIPKTGQSLVDVAFDLATRIDVFKLGLVDNELILRMIEQGETALNIRFARKTEIAFAASGSLNIAQYLCYDICACERIERTQARLREISYAMSASIEQTMAGLKPKFAQTVKQFVMLGGSRNGTTLRFLKELAGSEEGFLSLPELKAAQPMMAHSIARFLNERWMDRLYRDCPACANHLFFDELAQMLVIDDPQLAFYLKQQSLTALAREAGKSPALSQSKVFVCYSRKDKIWLERLEPFLKPIERTGIIDLWSDTRIVAGALRQEELQEALESSRVAILLLSTDFLASDFITQYELPRLLARAASGGTTILPVFVRLCSLLHDHALQAFQAVNDPAKPLSALRPAEREKVLVYIAENVLRLVKIPEL
ncbi:TIR domain-containing protein [Ktedonosporobacter rubrisoli]|uniref:TIR domain-containing protein n=1 Tax=Ktedonosporobacter rubrisoli TaxID=2509675 RepID=A0A4P6JLP1_KTERU|nr:TIR domain-containing protein [Ktedonosporobacter rubrisoli]QBD75912.1 TIR domain-containing protein [Ktedonosporobacter rubrisoli]